MPRATAQYGDHSKAEAKPRAVTDPEAYFAPILDTSAQTQPAIADSIPAPAPARVATVFGQK